MNQKMVKVRFKNGYESVYPESRGKHFEELKYGIITEYIVDPTASIDKKQPSKIKIETKTNEKKSEKSVSDDIPGKKHRKKLKEKKESKYSLLDIYKKKLKKNSNQIINSNLIIDKKDLKNFLFTKSLNSKDSIFLLTFC